MLNYIIRRCLYSIPIIAGVLILTFILFFIVNSPDRMAETMLGGKNVNPEAIEKWKRDHNYHLPRLFNTEEKSFRMFTQTIFYQKTLSLLWFEFGKSDRNNVDISYQIRRRMGYSLALTVPNFIIGLLLYIFVSMIIAFYRGSYLDIWGIVVCVLMMSIVGLFYIIGGQYVLGKLLKIFPISGFDGGFSSLKFLFMPILIGIIGGLGGSVLFYRTIFLEEINRDYIRTARSKGLSEGKVLFKHALKNVMIPILTGVVMAIPFLFMGSLIMESFFGIPGLGSFTIEAIWAQDFAIVRAMVYLGSVLTVVGLILTDISYTLVDPRVR
ncbi:MAG: ABC transporter permease, partial [Planctomycetes bacterium]|nr:ABC transporter permease [Planctomycetota bacterium]